MEEANGPPDESKLDKDTSNYTITIRSYCGGVSDVADSACLLTFKNLESMSGH